MLLKLSSSYVSVSCRNGLEHGKTAPKEVAAEGLVSPELIYWLSKNWESEDID